MTRELWLAGGCFWGTEKFLASLAGVQATDVGYANGSTQAPTYEQVCRENTGHAEAVHVVYDADTLPLEKLLDYYFLTIDPTSKNRQGGDTGTQYRTGVYYLDPADRPVIDVALENLQRQYDKPLAVEVAPLENYHKAEDYHQEYLDKNPGGYCHLSPGLFRLAEETRRYQKPPDAALREKLTPVQYEVTQQAATEPAYRNAYDGEFRSGIYVDVATGQPLFASADKYQSGCGWPAFSKPIDAARMDYRADNTHGMQRVEVKSRLGGSHLGHVFDDGPKDQGGLRYCINSAALRFVPKEDMEKEGYGDYLYLTE